MRRIRSARARFRLLGSSPIRTWAMDELTTHTSNKDENDPFLPVSTYPLSSELPPPSPGLLLPPQSFIHDVVQAATPALEIEKGRLRSGTIRSYAT